jgi:hypothetical protein
MARRCWTVFPRIRAVDSVITTRLVEGPHKAKSLLVAYLPLSLRLPRDPAGVLILSGKVHFRQSISLLSPKGVLPFLVPNIEPQ